MAETSRHCPICDEQREFEQPPCFEGHGSECPEWSCVTCGHAILVDFAPEVEIAEALDPAA